MSKENENLNEAENSALNIADVSNSTDYQDPMDIYSEEGTKVIYTGEGGYDHHKKHADKYLKVGETYTVDYTDVGGWNTDVYLKEVPNEGFNSVHFVNAG